MSVCSCVCVCEDSLIFRKQKGIQSMTRTMFYISTHLYEKYFTFWCWQEHRWCHIKAKAMLHSTFVLYAVWRSSYVDPDCVHTKLIGYIYVNVPLMGSDALINKSWSRHLDQILVLKTIQLCPKKNLEHVCQIIRSLSTDYDFVWILIQ